MSLVAFSGLYPTLMSFGHREACMAVIDLGQQGLQPGGVIDDYLRQHFIGGNEVHIPPGSYQWNGTGLSIDTSSDASLIGDGGSGSVELQITGPRNQAIDARGGATVEMRGINITGEIPAPGDGDIALHAWDGSSTIIVDDVWQMDGQAPGGQCIGFGSLDDRSTGTVIVRNSGVGYWPNNGMYFKPGPGARFVVENCFFLNNNIDALRLGEDATVRNCVFVVDQTPPVAWNGGLSGRGLRMRYAGNLTVEGCDFFFTEGDIPIASIPSGVSGRMDNVTLYSSNGHALESSTGYTGSGWHVSGPDGSNGVPSAWIECEGSTCRQPRTEPPTGGVTSGSKTERFEIVAPSGSRMSYEFTVGPLPDGSGPRVTAGAEAETAVNDTITSAGDTVTVTGETGSGFADDYHVTGVIRTFETAVTGYSLFLDGVEVTTSDLPLSTAPPTPQPETSQELVIRSDTRIEYSVTVESLADGTPAAVEAGANAEVGNNDTIQYGEGVTINGVTGGGLSDNYIVQGTITNITGLESGSTVTLGGREITVAQLPIQTNSQPPEATFDVSTSGLTVMFDASGSSDPDGDIASYTWQVGGATYTGEQASHTFAEAGEYDVMLTVTDAAGQQDTATQRVSVTDPNSPPEGHFDYSTNGLAVSFDGRTSTDPDGQVTSYQWDFGDGQSATGSTPAHTYAEAGSYAVTLTVTDNTGASDTVTKTVDVAEKQTEEPVESGLSAGTALGALALGFAIMGRPKRKNR